MSDYCPYCHANTEDNAFHAATCAQCGAPREWWTPEVIGAPMGGDRVAYWTDANTITDNGYRDGFYIDVKVDTRGFDLALKRLHDAFESARISVEDYDKSIENLIAERITV